MVGLCTLSRWKTRTCAVSEMQINPSEVLSSVRERVKRCISVPIPDAEALKICFACSIVESDALMELSHSRVVRAETRERCNHLSLSPKEFSVLLSDDMLSPLRKHNLNNALSTEEVEGERQRQNAAIERCLKLTLKEKAQRELWDSNPRVRARVCLSVLRKTDHVACIEDSIGQLLRSDLRLVEDLRYQTDIDGIDIMSVSSLVSIVCSHMLP